MNFLFVAVRSELGGSVQWSPVGRLDFDGEVYSFLYTKGVEKIIGFRPFDGMLDLAKRYESNELFPVFFNRLMPKRRAEYKDFWSWSGFNMEPDPIALLAVTEGIRQTDAIELFAPPIQNADGFLSSKFFLHGLSRMTEFAEQHVERLRPNDPLKLVLEPQNVFDPNAIGLYGVEVSGVKLGYVPRYLARDLNRIIEQCGLENVWITVEKVNSDAPLQQRLLCRLKACWPPGFVPCSDIEFSPINSDFALAVSEA